MGQIKNTFVKHLAKRLIEKYPDKFTNDFEKNKEELDKMITLESKKIRNLVAGCLVHVIRKKEAPSFEMPFQPKKEEVRVKRRRKHR